MYSLVYTKEYLIHIITGFIVSVLEAVAIPALLSKDFRYQQE
ncbi:YIEGIA domain-containing protein [Clostridium saccharobutylicum]|nr:hypothetical protein [Clostridium saccharobutylicum]MBC2413074.1 hypothetical protein [Clostridium saccharobutylicum]MBC2440288.1 hypothetical protein [Clostridium saccharobutylicum]MBC2445113.1 hypothetical protein [Clostridium saccharobutylicum]MBC2449682.1 hypothetical protein [Clostridium saccharobutylicum]